MFRYYYRSGDEACVQATVKARTDKLKTLPELKPFLNTKLGGGIRVYDSLAWQCLDEWQNTKEALDRFSDKEDSKEKTKLEHKEKAAMNRMSKFWKGTTDIGKEYIDALLDSTNNLRTRSKQISSMKAAANFSGISHRLWCDDMYTGHAIAIVFDREGKGYILNSSKPRNIDTIDSVQKEKKEDEVTRIRKNIQSFYSHMVHVQNIFEIDVVFNEETVKESKKVSEQKVVLQVTSDSIVVAIEKSITKKKRKACL